MLINFKEIPQANTGAGDQDDFELFARDFLYEIGYTIIEQPARGADGGKDLIVEINGERWMVSCKHFAHSGKAVGLNDELNILERVRATNCSGFLGFYSKIPSEALMNRLRGLKNDLSHFIYDGRKIESQIIGLPDRENLFMRYFPESYKKRFGKKYSVLPVRLFNDYLRRKYKNYIQFIEYVFGKTENLIRILLDNKSLEKVFEFQNLEILVSDAAIENIFRMKTIEESSQVQETMNKIFFEEIPQIIAEQKGIDIWKSVSGNIMMMPIIQNKVRKNSKRKPTYIQYHDDEPGVFTVEFCVIYRNHIIFTEKLEKAIDRVFNDLREMLATN